MKTSFLKHPLTILAGVVIGVLLGIFNVPLSAKLGVDSFARLIAVPGQLYLFYLQMTVIPIIITAIASSMGKLMRNKSSAGIIARFVAIFVVCVMFVTIAGMIVGMVGKPGAGMNENTRDVLSKLISSSSNDSAGGALEVNLKSGKQINLPAKGPSLMLFFRDLIPSNIFYALSMGSTMAIVFFSIIFGVAIGILREESASLLINLLSAVFEAFQKIINWSLYLLPFGLVCLMAGQIAEIGIHIFMAMSKFIILYGIGTVVIFIIATVVMWMRSGIANPLRVLSFVFEPALLSFATRNSMAALPSAITCLGKKLGFNFTSVNLTLPLGMTLGRFGNIFYFALATFFVAQIYNMPLSAMHYLIIFIGVIFSGTATAGASGIVTLSAIGIVLAPLGLPVEAVLVIFMAIDTIIDPLRTFLIVYVNMAATSLVAQRARESGDEKTLNVSIRESKKKSSHQDETSRKLEITLLQEIALRLGRELVIAEETERRPDILAGIITKDAEPPAGFVFSRTWARVTEHGVKKDVCFLLPAASPAAPLIDDVLKTLNAERFLAQKHGDEKPC